MTNIKINSNFTGLIVLLGSLLLFISCENESRLGVRISNPYEKKIFIEKCNSLNLEYSLGEDNFIYYNKNQYDKVRKIVDEIFSIDKAKFSHQEHAILYSEILDKYKITYDSIVFNNEYYFYVHDIKGKSLEFLMQELNRKQIELFENKNSSKE